MALTVRLPETLERLVDEVSHRRGMTKSDWVREALRRQAEQERGVSSYEIYLEIVGKSKQVGSGQENLARDAKRLVRNKVRAKHHR